jgi:FecR-like protein
MIPSLTGPRPGRPKAGPYRLQWPLSIALTLLFCLTMTDAARAYAALDEEADAAMQPALHAIRLAQAQPTPAPSPAPSAPSAQPSSAQPGASAQPPSAQPAASDEPIGNVATLTGTASVIRNQNTLPLKLKDDIYLNDVVTTFADSAVGVTFNDATTFNLTASASIKIDDFVYQDGGQQNSALFDVTKGTVAFVAAAVAKTGNMKITTPTATLGIRGTTGLVEVNGSGAGAHNIKLYPDPDGHVGTIDVSDRSSGARLGTLNQGASGFTVRAGAGGRVTAAPLAISPQQVARDQGVVRQVHAAQTVGRQVVNEQRALRRANPANRPNPQGQPGQRQNNPQQRQNNPQQRQNNLQQRGPQQPGSPNNRAGQQGRPGEPNRATEQRRPGEPNRAGQQGQPGQPNRTTEQKRPGEPNHATEQKRPGEPNHETQQGRPQQPPAMQRPSAPALHQGAAPNRPAAPPRRAPPPKKPPKERRR